MYRVYFNTGIYGFNETVRPGNKLAEFETLEEAQSFVAMRAEGKEKVHPSDNCTEGTSRECWWEIYDGPMVENPGTEDEVWKDPIYTSPTYYNNI